MSGQAAVVGGYMFVWRLACWCDAGHGPQCRLSTCAVVCICNAIIVSPRFVPVVLCICGVACLPEKYLWWPPKGAIAVNSWNQLETCVEENVQKLAEWYRTSDCMGLAGRPAELLEKAIQKTISTSWRKEGGCKNVCKVLQRISENGENLDPKDLERLEGIWNAVVQAASASVGKEAAGATSAACKASEVTAEVPGDVYTDSADPRAGCDASFRIPLWLQRDWGELRM